MSKILFGYFNGINNASKLLVDKINVNMTQKFSLRNSFTGCVSDIKKVLKNNEADYIICFGQWKIVKKDHLRIETTASIDGNEIITNFNYKELHQLLDNNNIKNEVSTYAGDYLCNFVYYYGLKYINEHNLKTKLIFIHIPISKDITNLDDFANYFEYLEKNNINF